MQLQVEECRTGALASEAVLTFALVDSTAVFAKIRTEPRIVTTSGACARATKKIYFKEASVPAHDPCLISMINAPIF